MGMTDPKKQKVQKVDIADVSSSKVMSDTVRLAIITGIVTVLTGAQTMVVAYMQYNTRAAVDASSKVAEKSADKVAEKLDDVNHGQAKKLDELQKSATETHILVNGNMGVQLKLHAATVKRLAELTKDPEDQKASELAQRAVDEHEKQAIKARESTKK